MRALWMVAYAVYGFAKLALPVRKTRGVPLTRQAVDLFRLGFGLGIDGMSYYLMELYRDPGYRRAGAALMRFETKNGLFAGMRLLVDPMRKQQSTGDKLFLYRCLKEAGLPCPPVLLAVHGNDVNYHIRDRRAYERDLFVKLRRGKGAKGVEVINFLPSGHYRVASGNILSFKELHDYLREKAKQDEYLLVPRLNNAPALAGLACDSLAPIRVVTCLDEIGRPIVALAYIRILGKLEKWGVPVELGAEVNLTTGRLGTLVGDKIGWHPLERFSVHPFTGVRVTEMILPYWPEVQEVARRAHLLFPTHAIIGWDIAVTADGPMILEGNTAPDVAFLQRVLDRPIGWTPLGDLLSLHIARLAVGPSLI